MISERNRFFFLREPSFTLLSAQKFYLWVCACANEVVAVAVCSPCIVRMGTRVKVSEWMKKNAWVRGRSGAKKNSRMRNEWNVIKKITALLCVCVCVCCAMRQLLVKQSAIVRNGSCREVSWLLCILFHLTWLDSVGCAMCARAIASSSCSHSYHTHNRTKTKNIYVFISGNREVIGWMTWWFHIPVFFGCITVLHSALGWNPPTHPLTLALTLYYYVRQSKCPIKQEMRNEEEEEEEVVKLCNKYLFLFYFIFFPSSSSSVSSSCFCIYHTFVKWRIKRAHYLKVSSNIVYVGVCVRVSVLSIFILYSSDQKKRSTPNCKKWKFTEILLDKWNTSSITFIVNHISPQRFAHSVSKLLAFIIFHTITMVLLYPILYFYNCLCCCRRYCCCCCRCFVTTFKAYAHIIRQYTAMVVKSKINRLDLFYI